MFTHVSHVQHKKTHTQCTHSLSVTGRRCTGNRKCGSFHINTWRSRDSNLQPIPRCVCVFAFRPGRWIWPDHRRNGDSVVKNVCWRLLGPACVLCWPVAHLKTWAFISTAKFQLCHVVLIHWEDTKEGFNDTAYSIIGPSILSAFNSSFSSGACHNYRS